MGRGAGHARVGAVSPTRSALTSAVRGLAAAEAWYVVSPALVTPMGQGIVATASVEDANRLAHTVQGRVLQFPQLAALVNDSPMSDKQP